MSRKICVVTGTRAEYGLLRGLMKGILTKSTLNLQLVVTGMHLSSTFGLTYKEIEKDGFKIDRKIKVIGVSDSNVDISKSIAKGIHGCAKAFEELQPDLVVLLGDRFEIFAAATAALVARIPIAHIHGGESTEGAIDEAFRHSITKMSHLHFVAAQEYRNRVMQLGENSNFIYVVGGLGVDAISKVKLLSREDLETDLKLKFRKKNLLITFHPVTLENGTAKKQMEELLLSLSRLENTTLIFTMSNADSGGRQLIKSVQDFVASHENAHAFESLGYLRYISCLALVDGVVGNSSSGLTEAPSLRKGTINIGDRQLGRLKAKSVIDCEPKEKSITQALEILYSPKFQKILESFDTPYGIPGATETILEVLESVNLSGLIKKSFHNL
jgi:GDP/UDP-N,N'-diacetylbacillosamine 2-epimerase (hydrolysing)